MQRDGSTVLRNDRGRAGRGRRVRVRSRSVGHGPTGPGGSAILRAMRWWLALAAVAGTAGCNAVFGLDPVITGDDVVDAAGSDPDASDRLLRPGP